MSILDTLGELYGESHRKSFLLTYDIEKAEPLVGLFADVMLSEKLKMSKEMTDFPIEKGSNFSDNCSIKPLELTLNCIISEDPLDETNMLYDTAFNVTDAFKAEDEFFDHNTFYNAIVDDFLASCMKETSILNVKIGMGYFVDFVVVDVDRVKNSDNTGVIEFTLTLKEFNFVTSEFTDMSEYVEYNPDIPDMPAVGKGGKGVAKKGQKPYKELTPEEKMARMQSLWYKFMQTIVKVTGDFANNW